MSNNPSTFKNENINVSFTREPGCRISLEIIVTPEATQASHHKAIKIVGKEVSVPGFRKGKAPEAMILKNFGKQVESEWKDLLLNTALEESFRLTHSFPFSKNSVKKASIKTASLQEGATLHFQYEEGPQVPSVNPEDLLLSPIARRTIGDSDVTNAIEDLRLRTAEWEEITDRPAQEGDYVEIDLDILSEPSRNVCTNARFQIASGKMDSWLRHSLAGMSADQTKEVMSEKSDSDKESSQECHACEEGTPHEHSHSHEKFVPALCRITLHSIKIPTLPPLDDELCKKYGASNPEELKERVIASLNKRADEEQQNAQRYMVEQTVIAKYPFDLPFSLIQGQIKEFRKSLIDDLRSGGTEESAIEAQAKKLEMDIFLKVDRDFRLYFLTQKIAEDNKIEVTTEEVRFEWMRQMWLQQMGENTIDTSKNADDLQSQLHLQLLVAKTLDFLIEKTGLTPLKI